MVTVACFSGGCTSAPRNMITQITPVSMLDGRINNTQMTCSDLTSYGNFGVTSLSGQEGEVIFVEGSMHRIRSDGTVCEADGTDGLICATVLNYQWESALKVAKRVDLAGVTKRIDEVVGDSNKFCAVKIDGRFLVVRTGRSVGNAGRPVAVVGDDKAQPVSNLEDASGTMIGFRIPAYAGGVSDAGYHFHFLSRGLTTGGPVVDFVLQEGAIEIDICDRLQVILPGSEK